MLDEAETLKEEACMEMETDVEKVMTAPHLREDDICREFLAEMEQMTKALKDAEGMYLELVKWKVLVEERFENIEKEKCSLVEEVRMLREMNDDLKKREEAEKVRVSEMEKSKITVKETIVKLTKKNRNLVDENLKLKREARVLREMNEEFKKREEALNAKVLELEKFKVTVEESLEKTEKKRGDLVVENSRLREMNEDLKKREEVQKSRILELEKFKEDTDLMKGNLKLRDEVRVLREMNEELRKREEVQKFRILELEKFKENGDLVKANLKLRDEVRVLREMNEEFQKQEQAHKVRVSELERRFKVTTKDSFEKIEKEKNDLLEHNLRLKKEVKVWREMNEELKDREVTEKVRVLELQSKIEVEKGLRMRAQADLEALQNGFKESESKSSMLDNANNMQITGFGLDSRATKRVIHTTSLMEAASCSRQCEAADGFHPDAKQNGALMEVAAGSPISFEGIKSFSVEPMMELEYDIVEAHVDQVIPKIQYNSKGQKLKSDVWEHMTKFRMEDNNVFVECNHCKRHFKAKYNSGTSHLRRHIRRCSAIKITGYM